MDYIKKVKNLSLNGNLSENWRRFKQNYDIFEEAAGIKTKPESIRIASFLNTIGEKAVEIFNGFDLSVEDRKDFAKIQNAFEKHCMAKKPILLERFQFFSRRQNDNETLKSFLADLVKLAATCEFTEQETSLVRDQFVLGILNKELQADLLLLEDKLNYDKIVELLELLSEARQHHETNTIIQDESLPRKFQYENIELKKKVGNEDKPKNDNDDEDKTKLKYFKNACKNCHLKHKFRDCPAFGKKCGNCFQLNHFAVSCKTRQNDMFKHPCKRCNLKHEYRNCPAFGKKCLHCLELNHFAICCRLRAADR